MQIKKQQLGLDMEKLIGSTLAKKKKKKYNKAVYCHSAYLTCIQSTSCEILGWMNHKLESILPGEIEIISDMQMLPPYWQKLKSN